MGILNPSTPDDQSQVTFLRSQPTTYQAIWEREIHTEGNSCYSIWLLVGFLKMQDEGNHRSQPTNKTVALGIWGPVQFTHILKYDQHFLAPTNTIWIGLGGITAKLQGGKRTQAKQDFHSRSNHWGIPSPFRKHIHFKQTYIQMCTAYIYIYTHTLHTRRLYQAKGYTERY